MDFATARLLAVMGLVAAALFPGGCANAPPSSPPPAPLASSAATTGAKAVESTSTTVTSGEPSSGPLQVSRPSVASAKRAVLAIAKRVNPTIPVNGVVVFSFGRDSRGIWWVEAGTDSPPQWESEQWFITWNGAKWVMQAHGTGMGQADFSPDIRWEHPEP